MEFEGAPSEFVYQNGSMLNDAYAIRIKAGAAGAMQMETRRRNQNWEPLLKLN